MFADEKNASVLKVCNETELKQDQQIIFDGLVSYFIPNRIIFNFDL